MTQANKCSYGEKVFPRCRKPFFEFILSEINVQMSIAKHTAQFVWDQKGRLTVMTDTTQSSYEFVVRWKDS